MRRLVLLFCWFISSVALSESIENDWFQVTGAEHSTFSVHGEAIQPAAFFQKLSFHSGIEIRYEKTMHEGLNLTFNDASLKELFRFVDAEFSTLKSYTRRENGEAVLTSLTILPKGQFQSTDLALAYDPIKEAVDHKLKKTSTAAQSVYVTRMEKLEIQVREQLEKLAEENIKHSERKADKRAEKKADFEKEKMAVVNDLRKWKKEDPEIYQHKLSVLAWRYPNLEDAVNNEETP